MQKILATVDDREYSFAADDLENVDLRPVGPGRYHLLRGGKSYDVEVESLDVVGKRVRLRVNGRPVDMRISDETDLLVKELGLSAVVDGGGMDVNAPMPGLVLKVMVEVGQEVEEGTPLLVLEAMKMENVLKAGGSGTVTAVHASPGEAVDKRQLLVEIE